MKYGIFYFKKKTCFNVLHVAECDVGFITVYGKTPCRKCPYPTYGKRCIEHCECEADRCHHVIGCLGITECDEGYTTEYGKTQCRKCPYPRYGWRCIEQCNCAADICNNVIGCVHPTTLIVTSTAVHIPEENEVTTISAANDTSSLNPTVDNIEKTAVNIILYGACGFLVILTILLVVNAWICSKLRSAYNVQEKLETTQHEHMYDVIGEENISYKDNEGVKGDNVILPFPDANVIPVTLDSREEKEYDHIYIDDGYLNPYDGLKMSNRHVYNTLRKQTAKQ